MSVQDRVAASFISRYFELLMTDAKQLASFYLPKAQFNHESKTTSITGSDNIARALARLYPQVNHGRVVIKEMKLTTTEASAGRFAFTVSGTYYRRGSTEGDEFRHVIELQEHQGSNGVYGIYADTRQLQKSAPTAWALETPPMFAKVANENVIPEIVQPPASEPVVAAAPVAPAQPEPTPKAPTPKVSPAATPAAPVEELASESQPLAQAAVAAEAEAAPAEPSDAAAAAPKAPASFLEMARLRAAKPASAAPPITRVEAKTEEQKAKEEAERLAKEEAAKKEKEAAATDRKRTAKPKKDGAEGEKKVSDDRKPASGAAAGAGAAAPTGDKRRKDAKVISHNVVFYDVIVKGLPADANEKSVMAMISPMAPVKKINVKSQPDKKDPTIIRTFAFVLFDHEAIIASNNATVAATIHRVTKEGTQKFGSQRIQIDEVREKFTQEDPREKVEA